MTLTLSPGTYVAWNGESVYVGHTNQPADLWEVSPFVARLLFRLTAGIDSFSYTAGLPPDVRDKAREVLDMFERQGLVLRGAPPSSAAGIRNVEDEVKRNIAPHDDIFAVAPEFEHVFRKAHPYTYSTPPVAFALYQSVAYVVRNATPGDVVECGVGRGGSAYIAALALVQLGSTTRSIWLYDTFDGRWERPGNNDGFVTDDSETRCLRSAARDNRLGARGSGEGWFEDGLSGARDVRRLVESTGYPAGNVRTVEGLIQETIPGSTPASIAILRLDTDFYESTLHELRHLYPLLVPGGVLIVDDYGKHLGATRAVDEYFATEESAPLLVRLDTQGCLGIKSAPANAGG